MRSEDNSLYAVEYRSVPSREGSRGAVAEGGHGTGVVSDMVVLRIGRDV